jgi:hypothetical protein
MKHVLELNWEAESDAEVRATLALAADTDNQAFVVGLAYTALKLFYLVSSVAATVRTKTAGGVTVNTFALEAGVPVLWTTGMGTCPVTGDFASLSVDVAGAVVGTLELRALPDATPPLG